MAVRPGGQVKPNDLGLFDLLGNVYEWCQDQLGSSPANDYAIAQLMANGSMVREKDPGLFRGGAFTDHAANVRSAYRNWVQPWNRSNNLGFRLARTYP
jgi:eukaryotic-like serine/threonine-protein kinase